MAGQKSGGGSKKIGRNKVKCTSYLNRGIREKHKISNFIEHNIPKDITTKERETLISSFTAIQSSRKKKVAK